MSVRSIFHKSHHLAYLCDAVYIQHTLFYRHFYEISIVYFFMGIFMCFFYELIFDADNRFIMTRCRFLIAACIGTFFYVLLSFIGGRDGLWATEQMQEQKRILSANAASIQKTYDELYMEKIALQKDMDVVAAFARRLGYIREGEKIIKISGLAPNETQIYDAGTVVKHTEGEFIPEWVCKSVGVGIFAVLYAFLLFLDFTRGLLNFGERKVTYTSAAGTKLYDMQ
ncbi:MAG: septum formation initiator family protein [Treponema sp.]|nr:septum formation initiator family protein [Treponema sp.]